MPAHCSLSAVGRRILSDGSVLSRADLGANDLVDGMAKKQAAANRPTRSEYKIVNDANLMVTSTARWNGVCTVQENPFPFPGRQGKAVHIRDNTGVCTNRVKVAAGSDGKLAVAIKRKKPSSTACNLVAKVQRSPTSSEPVKTKQSTESAAGKSCLLLSEVKRLRLTAKQVESRDNFVFMEYWLANRQQGAPKTLPSILASTRRLAVLERLAVRSSLPRPDAG